MGNPPNTFFSHNSAIEYLSSQPLNDSRLCSAARRILEAVDLLEPQPEIGRPGRILGTRELVVPRTPYLIPYRVRKGRIELIAIFDGHQQSPGKL